MIVEARSSELHSDAPSEDYTMHNVALLEEALSSRMYKDPHYAVVREILTNARDAHREVGTPDRPVEVAFPTHQKAELRIRDFGPGISAERMRKNFTGYCASTKTTDNRQTGGWGLGCKTPFSVSRSFLVETTAVDADGVKRWRLWSHHKNTEGRSAFSILDECEAPDGATGTELRIPVSRNFRDEMVEAYRKITRWWSPIPEPVEEPSIKPDPHGYVRLHEWFALGSKGSDSMAIVDGIPYKIPWRIGSHLPLILFFNTGDVPVTLTRDDLDAKAEKLILDRVDAIRSLLRQKKIQADSMRDAIRLGYAFDVKVPFRGFDGVTTMVIPPLVMAREIDKRKTAKIQAIHLSEGYCKGTYGIFTTERKTFAQATKEWMGGAGKEKGFQEIVVVRVTSQTPPALVEWLGQVSNGRLEDFVQFSRGHSGGGHKPGSRAERWVIENFRRVPDRRPAERVGPALYVLAGENRFQCICSVTGKPIPTVRLSWRTRHDIVVLRSAEEAHADWIPLRKQVFDQLRKLREQMRGMKYATVGVTSGPMATLTRLLNRATTKGILGPNSKAVKQFLDEVRKAESHIEHLEEYQAMAKEAGYLWSDIPPAVVQPSGSIDDMVPASLRSLLAMDVELHRCQLVASHFQSQEDYSI